jgi:hypothetical protein
MISSIAEYPGLVRRASFFLTLFISLVFLVFSAEPGVAASNPAVPAAGSSFTPPIDRPYKGDPWTYSDGTFRYSLELAGGVAVPAGATRTYQNTAGGFRLGLGANLNKYAGALLEYDFNNFGVPSKLINRAGSFQYPVSGRVHIWSVTLNPVIHFYRSEASDAYVIGGGGFYRKLVRFSTTSSQNFCYTNCLTYPTTLSQFSNNAGGVNFGLGIAHRIMLGSKVRAFTEARYVWIDNQRSSGNGVYTPAYYRTGYFPVVVGLKW